MKTTTLALALLALLASVTGAPGRAAAAHVRVVAEDRLTSAPRLDRFISESEARFQVVPNRTTWVSDAEHVTWEATKEVFIANGTPPYLLAADTLPARRIFELFPYHYLSPKEVPLLGGRPLHYRLEFVNSGNTPIAIELFGIGTTRSWDHQEAWAGALAGSGARKVALPPGAVHTLWEARALEPGLPWSGIILGRADAPLLVREYVFTEEGPLNLESARVMPDLAWPPYLLASFTRGLANWNMARISPRSADSQTTTATALKLSAFTSAWSCAVGYSPGGPITNLCEYLAIAPTFARDTLLVKDSLSGYTHPFFGGSYPIRYEFTIPVENDTDATRSMTLAVRSNDRFRVDSLVGVSLAPAPDVDNYAFEKHLRPDPPPLSDRFFNHRAPWLARGAAWRAVRWELPPHTTTPLRYTVVPLGSRWGGLIVSLVPDSAW